MLPQWSYQRLHPQHLKRQVQRRNSRRTERGAKRRRWGKKPCADPLGFKAHVVLIHTEGFWCFRIWWMCPSFETHWRVIAFSEDTRYGNHVKSIHAHENLHTIMATIIAKMEAVNKIYNDAWWWWYLLFASVFRLLLDIFGIWKGSYYLLPWKVQRLTWGAAMAAFVGQSLPRAPTLGARESSLGSGGTWPYGNLADVLRTIFSSCQLDSIGLLFGRMDGRSKEASGQNLWPTTMKSSNLDFTFLNSVSSVLCLPRHQPPNLVVRGEDHGRRGVVLWCFGAGAWLRLRNAT